MDKRTRFLAGGAMAVALMVATLLGLGYTSGVLAHGDGSSRYSDYYQTFLGKVSAILGIETETLQGAVTQAQLEILDEAVQEGKVSEDRAARLQERIEKGGYWGRGGSRGHKMRFSKLWKMGSYQAVSDLLGMTRKEIFSELKDGEGLAQIGEEHGVSREDLKSVILASARERMDAAVAEGKHTQEEADAKLSRMEGKIDQLLDRTYGGRRHGDTQTHALRYQGRDGTNYLSGTKSSRRHSFRPDFRFFGREAS